MARLTLPAQKRPKLMLTPLVDAIFILVFFFMLATQFEARKSLIITPSPTGQGLGAAEGFLLLRATPEGLSLNGRQIEADRLIEEINRAKDAGVKSLTLQTVQGVSVQQLVGLLEKLNSVEGLSIAVDTAAGQ